MSELKELLESILSELDGLIKFKNDILKSNVGPYSEDEPDWHDGETCHLLQLAIRDLGDEWISVDDRLPEEEMCKVLVYCEGGNIAISYFIKDREQARSFHSNRGKYKGYTRKHAGKNSCHFDIAHKYSYKITHWKPLPQPPINKDK